MIIAMEKLQTQGDALHASNSVLENAQSNETELKMFQGIARTYESALTSSPNPFDKKSSVQAKNQTVLVHHLPKEVKCKQGKD